MHIECLAQGHNMLMPPVFDPSIAVSRNQDLTNMTNMFLIFQEKSDCILSPVLYTFYDSYFRKMMKKHIR